MWSIRGDLFDGGRQRVGQNLSRLEIFWRADPKMLTPRCRPEGAALHLEGGGGGGFGFEGGDGFDEARDGEGIADAALATDQVESATLAG